ADDLLHLAEERVGGAPGRVAAAAAPQERHRQLGQVVTGEEVDGATLDHLPGRAQAVAEESRAVRDPDHVHSVPTIEIRAAAFPAASTIRRPWPLVRH